MPTAEKTHLTRGGLVCLAFSLLFSLSLSLIASSATAQTSPACELDREVRFAGLSWLSNLITVEIQRFIIEHGYGCDTAVESGDSLPMLAAVVRGDVDIDNEIWVNSVAEVWTKAEADGRVVTLGNTYSGGYEGWYVPRYLVDKHPDLKSVKDLARYTDLFADPEEPGKGRIYSCPSGWSCEVVNANLLKAFGLDESYVLFSPGSGAALDAAITSNYRRKRPMVFYYWAPSAIIGNLDLVQLEMPEHQAEGHACNLSSECETPYPGGFPVSEIHLGVNTDFTRSAPLLTEFLRQFNIPTETVNTLLAWAENNDAEAEEAAMHFLENYRDTWSGWIGAEVLLRVDNALATR